MLHITICRGISGSGKSTWAKEEVKKAQGRTVIVCKDDIRGMLWNGDYSSGREALVKSVRNSTIIAALEEGKNVIVADTNFDRHEQDIRDLVGEWADKNKKKIDISVQDFTHVPLKVCIERDKGREKCLGEKVIKEQHKRWIKKDADREYNFLPTEDNKKNAYVFDMDGTLTQGPHNRGPFEWHKVGQDLVNPFVANMARAFHGDGNNTILIVSGRDGGCRLETEKWLKDNQIPYHELIMRTPNDNRPDDIVKEEIIDRDILPRFNVMAWVDDRLKVCQMIHKKGLPLFRVGNPDADF